MLVLKKLKVAGFRGFATQRELALDAKATILFGENHSGKSSTLNAIEWCLFGDACKGKQTEIRERVNWEFVNRHLQAPEVRVQLELEGPAGRCTVTRTLKPRGRRTTTMEEELTVILPDGTKLVDEKADAELSNLVRRFSFKDFMTTVYQHQEVIRAILTQEPRDRNDAIDRLLGLSDYRNLLSAIDQADLTGTQKGLGQKFTAFEGKITNALQTRAADLKDKWQEALDAGVPKAEQNEKGGLKLATVVLKSLEESAEGLGVNAPACEVPDEWKRLKSFRKSARADMDRMRSEMPEAKKQEDLFKQRESFSQVKSRYESRKEDRDTAAKDLREFETQRGNEAKMKATLEESQEKRDQAKQELRETSSRAALVDEAIKYLAKSPDGPLSSTCPLCGHKAPDLLDHLRKEYEQKIEKQTQQIKEKIDSFNIDIDDLKGLLKKHQDFCNSLGGAEKKLLESRTEVAKLLGKNLEDDDDPMAMLNRALGVISKELQRLADALQRKQKRLTEIEGELDKISLVWDILEMEQKKSVIERIKESSEYIKLESFRDEAAQLVENVKAVKAAVASASNKEAKEKISSAEKNIDSFFRSLTNYPELKKLKMTVQSDARNRNSYDFMADDDQDLRPILSQGDLNALALSIFLGLACAGGDANPFGFVILDDFSQSLGTEHKSRLAAILNDVLETKHLLLSTMDAEMRALLDSNLTKRKNNYHFADWTPDDGPSINCNMKYE